MHPSAQSKEPEKAMKAERPLVSLYIVAYNHADTIAEAVESALWQDYSPLQIVISDDASKDATFEVVRRVIEKYRGPHAIRLNRNTENLGLIRHVDKVNRELVQGELIVGQAGDDISLPHRVRLIAETWLALGRPDCLINSSVWRLDRDGDKTLWIPPYIAQCLDDTGFASAQALYIGASVAYSRGFIEQESHIDEIEAYEDLVWGFRAQLRRQLVYIPEPLVVWRAYGGLSSTPRPFAEMASTSLAVLRQRRTDALRLGRPDLAAVAERTMAEIESRLTVQTQNQPQSLSAAAAPRTGAPSHPSFESGGLYLTRVASLAQVVVDRFRPCKRILLVGTQAALLVQTLKTQLEAAVIELCVPPGVTLPPMAQFADAVRHVWLADASGPEDLHYDAVLCAGHLEHCPDIATELKALRQWMQADAELMLAFSNAGSIEVLDRLARGRCADESAVAERLFTPVAVQRLLEAQGLRVESWYALASPQFLREGTRRSGHVERIATERVTVKVADEAHQRLLESSTLIVSARAAGARTVLGADAQELYALWITTHTPQGWMLEEMRQRISAWQGKPVFHLGIIAEDARINALIGTLASLGEQLWEHWRLSIVARQPCPEALLGFHPVIQWHRIAADAEAVIALNRLLLDEPADFVGQIEAGDRLAVHALYAFADKFALHPEWQAAYCDEDSLDEAGRRQHPYFKSDFDIDALRAAPFVVGGVWLMRREAFRQLGGYLSECAGVENYDLQLRAWERYGDPAIGHIADVLYHRDPQAGHIVIPPEELKRRRESSLRAHLERQRLPAEIEEGVLPGTLRVGYRLTSSPLVSVLIPTRNRLDLLRRCLESLLERTSYTHYEIVLVDNGSDEAAVFDYYAALQQRLGERFRWIRYDQPFNYAAMMNLGAEAARGDVLLLLNNDIHVLDSDWLGEMLALALRPDVGVVGARLLSPDGRIQHAGIVLGMNNLAAEHPYCGELADIPGYYGHLRISHTVSAVTGACLLIRRDLYQQVGGMDAERLAVNFNDVDLCLKVSAAGYRVVWTPHATLVHEGSATLRHAHDEAEAAARLKDVLEANRTMFARWGDRLGQDPAYNRNLSLSRARAYQIEVAPALSWDPEWRPRPRVLAHPADRQGCGEYRVIAPMRVLTAGGHIMGWETGSYLGPAELARMRPDAIVLQRQVTEEQIQLIQRYRDYGKVFRVFEIDDLITNVPIKSPMRRKFVEQKDLYKRLRKAVRLCDRFVVSTEYLAEEYRPLGLPVVVVQNHLEGAVWLNLPAPKRREGKPRVGWAGAGQHHGDLAILNEVIKATANEVDWVFLGMCVDGVRPYVKEFHPGVPIEEYPAKLASLDLDLALAPLEDVPFNHAKSHLRLLEYGILGYPVVCTDITPYRGEYPVTRVPNRFKAWYEAIMERVSDREALQAEGERLREYIRREWILEDHADRWLAAWLP